MKESQWLEMEVLVRELWAEEFSEAASAAWFSVLGQYDVGVVERAIRTELLESPRFRPGAGMIAVRCEELVAPAYGYLPFDQAMRIVKFALKHGPAWKHMHWILQTEDPVVSAWAHQYGLERLWAEPMDDPEVSGKVLGRLRKEYEVFCERHRQGEVSERVMSQPSITAGGTKTIGEAVNGVVAELERG